MIGRYLNKRWRRTDSVRVNEAQTGRILARENGEKQTGAQREQTDREREDLKGTAENSIATSLRSLSEVNAMRQFRI